ncbi:MAG: hypothetical protein JSS02_23295 [Planctomycetes bacterium]|nr:hypothetical protein [Planctomycetota bacterium]
MHDSSPARNHTPGPWFVDPYGASDTGHYLIKPIPGPVVCELDPLPEAAANAPLIAAAPELFQILLQFESACESRIADLREASAATGVHRESIERQLRRWQDWRLECQRVIKRILP